MSKKSERQEEDDHELDNLLLNENNISNEETLQNNIFSNAEDEEDSEYSDYNQKNIDFNIVSQLDYNNPRREANHYDNQIIRLNGNSTNNITKTHNSESQSSLS